MGATVEDPAETPPGLEAPCRGGARAGCAMRDGVRCVGGRAVGPLRGRGVEREAEAGVRRSFRRHFATGCSHSVVLAKYFWASSRFPTSSIESCGPFAAAAVSHLPLEPFAQTMVLLQSPLLGWVADDVQETKKSSLLSL